MMGSGDRPWLHERNEVLAWEKDQSTAQAITTQHARSRRQHRRPSVRRRSSQALSRHSNESNQTGLALPCPPTRKPSQGNPLTYVASHSSEPCPPRPPSSSPAYTCRRSSASFAAMLTSSSVLKPDSSSSHSSPKYPIFPDDRLCLAQLSHHGPLPMHTCISPCPLAANCTVVPAPCDGAMGPPLLTHFSPDCRRWAAVIPTIHLR